uniref:Uncharacterized protein n=1 Tax=viral metagenome TaxID=1070528 RepID=A0A6M3LLZ7_9ZZZZ
MEIENITKEDTNEITAVFVDAVLMPNGEIIRYGKTIQQVRDDLTGIFKRA